MERLCKDYAHLVKACLKGQREMSCISLATFPQRTEIIWNIDIQIWEYEQEHILM